MNEAVWRTLLEPSRGVWRLARLGLFALLAGLPAAREAAASELIWQGPPECAAGEQLRFVVERALGVPLESASRLSFEVRVEVSNGVTSGRLRVMAPDAHAATTERAFVVPDCSQLVDTLGVAITLAIASSAPSASSARADSKPAPSGSSGAAPPPAPHPTPTPPAPTAPDVDHGGTLHPSALFSLVGDSGSLPSPAVGASLGGELGLKPIAVHVLGTLLFEQRVRLASTDGDAAADIRSMFGTLEGCANVLTATSALSVPVCAGADAGMLSGSGVSIARPRRASAPWLALRAGAGLLWNIPVTRLRLDMMLTAVAPLIRDEFAVQGIGAVHRASRIVGRASVGFAVLF